jgi:hypothetical protein
MLELSSAPHSETKLRLVVLDLMKVKPAMVNLTSLTSIAGWFTALTSRKPRHSRRAFQPIRPGRLTD